VTGKQKDKKQQTHNKSRNTNPVMLKKTEKKNAKTQKHLENHSITNKEIRK
jgi:hypothetical protein